MKQVSIMEYEQREDGSVSTRPLFVDQFVGPELGEPFIAFLGSLAVCPSFDKEYGFRIFLHVTGYILYFPFLDLVYGVPVGLEVNGREVRYAFCRGYGRVCVHCRVPVQYRVCCGCVY